MILAFDTETYEYDEINGVYRPVLDARKFVLGHIKTEKGVKKFFYDREEMFEWIRETIHQNIKEKRRTYLYAHNTEYDWYAIAHNHFIEKDMKYILFHAFLGIYKQKAYYVDTMAFHRTTLERVGNILGIEKLEMPQQVRDIKELEPYIERDVEIVLKAVMNLKNRLNALGFKPRKIMTAGQVAMTCFSTFNRRNFTEKYFTVYNAEKKRREIIRTKYPDLVREAYRGGDNQAYQIGKFNNLSLVS